MRHYWALASAGGLIIEATTQAGPNSIYLTEDSGKLLPLDPSQENELNDCAPKRSEDETESVLKKYSHLIERQSEDNPFKFTLKYNDPQVFDLTFRQIEILVRDQLEHKHSLTVDKKYLNPSLLENRKESGLVTSSKWWLCDNEVLFKQLNDCLSKRGYRERLLGKSLGKIAEDALDPYATSVLPSEMFEKMNAFFKEFIPNQINQRRNHMPKQAENKEQVSDIN